MSFIEPISSFFADFAQTVTLDGASVSAIFDNDYELAEIGSVGMSASGPALTLATADVPADPVGASAVVGSTSYIVAEHRPDGLGVSVLLLELA